MHLRLSTVRRGSKTYRYAQLVESFRRPADGRPSHRVLANLGALGDEQIANLRAALEANRGGDALVVPARGAAVQARATAQRGPVVTANYRYLDLAVLLRLWSMSGLEALFRDLSPEGQEEVSVAHVVGALVLHRCVAPGSKLAAERWFPGTALPELLAVQPAQFNNSRVHRVLEVLERIEPALQARLAHVVQHTQGRCVRLFIDATDTWFVGQGPKLAAKGKDKEGLIRRRIGIVLLCDQRGFPLRWATLAGTFHDATALLEMAALTASLDWVTDQPVVLDRAVGNAGAVATLVASGLRFVTALPWIEFVSSGAPIPWDKVAALQAAALAPGVTAASVVAVGEEQGFRGARPDRLLLDLGVFEKAPPKANSGEAATVIAMRFASDIEASTASNRTLARERGVSDASVRRHRLLLRLDKTLQRRTRAGEARSIGVEALHRIAALPITEQVSAFDALIAESPERCRHARSTAPDPEVVPPLRTRGVLLFNPEGCRQSHDADEQRLSRLKLAIDRLNDRLAVPGARWTDGSALAAAHKLILAAKFGNVVAARLVRTGTLRAIALDQDEAAWAARRQANGVSVIVTHAELPGTPEEIAQLYVGKDVIEKDFQTIKSTVELRPIHHQTDVKLRAHVTLCVLALLLMRILREHLARTATATSAVAALEILATAHLNLISVGQRDAYTITQLSPEQQSLLAALKMEDLARDDKAAAMITPR